MKDKAQRHKVAEAQQVQSDKGTQAQSLKTLKKSYPFFTLSL